jgi:hypothetical protein
VLGVVADHRVFGAEADPPAQIFLPYARGLAVDELRRPRAADGGGRIAVERAVRQVEPAVKFLGKPNAAPTDWLLLTNRASS